MYSYALQSEGPWIDMFESSAKALETGRSKFYDLEGERPDIFVAKISLKSVSDLLRPDMLADTLIAEAKEAAVTGQGNDGDDFVSFIDGMVMDEVAQLSINLQGVFDWWQQEYEVPMVPHVEEVRAYEAEQPLDNF